MLMTTSVFASDSYICNYNISGTEDSYSAQASIYEIAVECFKKLEAQFPSIDREKKMNCNYSITGNMAYNVESQTTTDIPEKNFKKNDRILFDECKKSILDHLNQFFQITLDEKPFTVLVDRFIMQTQIKIDKKNKNLTIFIEKME